MYETDTANPVLIDYQGQLLDSSDMGADVGSWYVVGTIPVSLEMVSTPCYSYNAPWTNGYAARLTVDSAGWAPNLVQRGFDVVSGQGYAVQLAIRKGAGTVANNNVSVRLRKYDFSADLSNELIFDSVLLQNNEWWLLRGMLYATETTSAAFWIQCTSLTDAVLPGLLYVDACGLFPAVDLHTVDWSVDATIPALHQRTRGGALHSFYPGGSIATKFVIDCDLVSSAELCFIQSLWLTPARGVGLYETLSRWRESEYPYGAASLHVYGRIVTVERPLADAKLPHGSDLHFGKLEVEFY